MISDTTRVSCGQRKGKRKELEGMEEFTELCLAEGSEVLSVMRKVGRYLNFS